MRLGVEHPLLQRQRRWRREEEVEVLEGLRQEEGVHPVQVHGRHLRHVVYRGVTSVMRQTRGALDAFEEPPAPFSIRRVARLCDHGATCMRAERAVYLPGPRHSTL